MRGALALAILMTMAPLVGCIGTLPTDDVESAATDGPAAAASWAKAIPEVVAGIAPLAHAADVPTGSGIWLDGDYAFVSARPEGAFILDVSDPSSPKVVTQLADLNEEGDGELYSRDADVKWYDGKRILALAGANQGIHLFDVTDVLAPVKLATIELERGSHNIALHPTMPVLYNSNSNGKGAANEVIDIANPAEPKLVGTYGEYGCHDITFFISEDKKRLYCPGIDLTEIWDISAAFEPQLVVQIVNDAAKSYDLGLHHSAMTPDGTLLIIGDEFNGGGGPGGCFANTPAGSTPFGALWFYDVSDEKSPKLLSHLSPTAPVENYAKSIAASEPNPANPLGVPFGALGNTSCTTHFGDFLPGKDMLVMSWYRAGVFLVDYSDPAKPFFVDQWSDGTDTWDVQEHNGYLFTGDIVRGFDVLELVAG